VPQSLNRRKGFAQNESFGRFAQDESCRTLGGNLGAPGKTPYRLPATARLSLITYPITSATA